MKRCASSGSATMKPQRWVCHQPRLQEDIWWQSHKASISIFSYFHCFKEITGDIIIKTSFCNAIFNFDSVLDCKVSHIIQDHLIFASSCLSFLAVSGQLPSDSQSPARVVFLQLSPTDWSWHPHHPLTTDTSCAASKGGGGETPPQSQEATWNLRTLSRFPWI